MNAIDQYPDRVESPFKGYMVIRECNVRQFAFPTDEPAKQRYYGNQYIDEFKIGKRDLWYGSYEIQGGYIVYGFMEWKKAFDYRDQWNKKDPAHKYEVVEVIVPVDSFYYTSTAELYSIYMTNHVIVERSNILKGVTFDFLNRCVKKTYKMVELVRKANCPFCKEFDNIQAETSTCVAVLDQYPVSEGHTLIIPKRHVESINDLTYTEWENIHTLIKECCDGLKKWRGATGFNIGVNEGRSAGRTVDHLHVHIIPRYDGDVKNPKGGIRGVIPGKQQY